MFAPEVVIGGGNDSPDTSPSTSRSNSIRGAPSHQCVTLWEPIKISQEWTITHFARAIDLAAPGICLRSKPFAEQSMQDIQWQLCLYPGGKREENKGNVSLFLKMSSATPREYTVRAEYRFYFIDDLNVPKFSNVNVGDFKVKPQKGSHSWGLRNIPKAKVLPCLTLEGSLRILCQVMLIPEINKLNTVDVLPDSSLDVSSVTKDYLQNILTMANDELVDCTIFCNDEEFRVHKFLLVAHSEVFRAMFTHDTKERSESKVVIEDSTPKAVKQMLHYIYSSNLSDDFTDEDASEVLQIADKYNLEPLKVLVQKRLAEQLTVSNVCSIFQTAYLHNAHQLMESCVPVFYRSSKMILQSDAWRDLSRDYMAAANIILQKLVTYREDHNPVATSPPNKRQRMSDLHMHLHAGPGHQPGEPIIQHHLSFMNHAGQPRIVYQAQHHQP